MMTRRVVVVPGPAYRPPAYRPPVPGLGQRELGQAGPSINWANVGETIMFAAFGAGAMYAAPILPDPMKTIAMVGGVGLIGYAAYSFLGTGTNTTVRPQNKPFEAPTPTQFAGVFGRFTKPAVRGSSESWTFFGQNYDVEILVTNPDPNNETTVTFQIIAKEIGLPFDYLFNNVSNEYVAASVTETLKKKESKPIPLTLSVRMNRWINPRVAVLLTLKKLPVKGEAVVLDETSLILH